MIRLKPKVGDEGYVTAVSHLDTSYYFSPDLNLKDAVSNNNR